MAQIAFTPAAPPAKHATPESTLCHAAPAHPGPVYYPWFDWLRIILALVVALGHDHVITWHHGGNLAVQVFFALSGWLIGGILLGTTTPELPHFYYNRATRIWIPYAAALAILLGVSIWRDPLTWKYLEFVFYKITFTYNIFGAGQFTQFSYLMPLHGTGNHFWSICAEEQFYLLAPLLLVVAPRRVGRSLLVWSFGVLLALYLSSYATITLGVLAAIAQRRWGSLHARWPAQLLLATVVVGGAVIMALDALPYEWVVPWFAIAVVLLLAREGKKVALGAFLGGISYPLYLNHWVGIFSAHALLTPLGLRQSALAKMLSLLANLGFCSVLYLLIDRQVLSRRNRWYRPAVGWTLAFSGFALVTAGVVGGIVMTHR